MGTGAPLGVHKLAERADHKRMALISVASALADGEEKKKKDKPAAPAPSAEALTLMHLSTAELQTVCSLISSRVASMSPTSQTSKSSFPGSAHAPCLCRSACRTCHARLEDDVRRMLALFLETTNPTLFISPLTPCSSSRRAVSRQAARTGTSCFASSRRR